MKTEGNIVVFIVLGVALVAVAVHLFLWSRRQSGSLKRFAESKGLVHRSADVEDLESRINDCVALEEPGLTRTFGQLGDIVSLGNGRMFRAVELRDLRPWGKTEYTHQARVAVMFPVDCGFSGIFSVSPKLVVRQLYPESPASEEEVRSLLEHARVGAPPCMLSLTLMRGQAVAYLEPGVVGSVDRKGLEYLEGLVLGLGG